MTAALVPGVAGAARPGDDVQVHRDTGTLNIKTHVYTVVLKGTGSLLAVA